MSGIPSKDAVNEAIRAGLKAGGKPTRFRQQTFPLGTSQANQWDKALQVADALGERS